MRMLRSVRFAGAALAGMLVVAAGVWLVRLADGQAAGGAAAAVPAALEKRAEGLRVTIVPVSPAENDDEAFHYEHELSSDLVGLELMTYWSGTVTSPSVTVTVPGVK